MAKSSSRKLSLLTIIATLAISTSLFVGLGWRGQFYNIHQASPSQDQIDTQPDFHISKDYIPSMKPFKCNCNISQTTKTVESSLSVSDSQYASWAKEELRKQFQPSITPAEKAKFVEALRVLTNSLDSVGIHYFMFGGTLIGSWRHHDMIPWDDDVDIVVNDSDRHAVARLNLANYTMNTRNSFRYRFMCNDGVPSKGEPDSKWPFIDIVFFESNGTHIHNMWPPMSKVHVYRNSDILPLKRRPYGNLALYSPQKPLVIIKDAADVCMTREWSHRDVVKLPQVYKEECKLLRGIYPFVIRNNGSDTERLYLDGKLIQTVKLQPA